MYVGLLQERQTTTEYDPVYEDEPNPSAWIERMSLLDFCLLCAVGFFCLVWDKVRRVGKTLSGGVK